MPECLRSSATCEHGNIGSRRDTPPPACGDSAARECSGLVVDLNQVHLTITGETGPGNLLGNLLCGLANALNGGGGGLANLLNRLLGL